MKLKKPNIENYSSQHMFNKDMDSFLNELAKMLEEADKLESKKELEELDILDDVLGQACFSDGEYDSMALSAYARGLRFLAKKGIVKIEREYGRRVIAVLTEKGKEMIKEMEGRGVERSAQEGNVVVPDADAQKLREAAIKCLKRGGDTG